jgi:hypothetical protein
VLAPAYLCPLALTTGKDGKKGEVEAEPPPETITSVFIPGIEAAISEYVAKWQQRDESANFSQSHDEELVKEELRPLVFEDVRKQVGGVVVVSLPAEAAA